MREEARLTVVVPRWRTVESHRRSHLRTDLPTPLYSDTGRLASDQRAREAVDTGGTLFGGTGRSRRSGAEDDIGVGQQVDLGVEVVIGLYCQYRPFVAFLHVTVVGERARTSSRLSGARRGALGILIPAA